MLQKDNLIDVAENGVEGRGTNEDLENSEIIQEANQNGPNYQGVKRHNIVEYSKLQGRQNERIWHHIIKDK